MPWLPLAVCGTGFARWCGWGISQPRGQLWFKQKRKSHQCWSLIKYTNQNNLHYDVHDPTENVEWTLCSFRGVNSKSMSMSTNNEAPYIPSAKRENNPPRVSMLKNTQSARYQSVLISFSFGPDICTLTYPNNTTIPLPQFKVRRQQASSEKDSCNNANDQVRPMNTFVVRDLTIPCQFKTCKWSRNWPNWGGVETYPQCENQQRLQPPK